MHATCTTARASLATGSRGAACTSKAQQKAYTATSAQNHSQNVDDATKLTCHACPFAWVGSSAASRHELAGQAGLEFADRRSCNGPHAALLLPLAAQQSSGQSTARQCRRGMGSQRRTAGGARNVASPPLQLTSPLVRLHPPAAAGADRDSLELIHLPLESKTWSTPRRSPSLSTSAA
jgi:hypothetical protein